MNDTTRELGGALGVAVLGSITTSRFASELAPNLDGLPDASRDLASSGLTGVARVAGDVSGPAGDALRSAADLAFVGALRTAALIACLVILMAAAGARLLLPRPTRPSESESGSGSEPERGLESESESGSRSESKDGSGSTAAQGSRVVAGTAGDDAVSFVEP